ncbi:hypothetical protein M422DRAFT_83169, partial [Sphaerobolus stellatus SS14]
LLYNKLLFQTPLQMQHIWKRPMSEASILFLVNRYITPLQFIVIVTSFYSSAWS